MNFLMSTILFMIAKVRNSKSKQFGVIQSSAIFGFCLLFMVMSFWAFLYSFKKVMRCVDRRTRRIDTALSKLDSRFRLFKSGS